jgi:hypothetical protein
MDRLLAGSGANARIFSTKGVMPMPPPIQIWRGLPSAKVKLP